MKTSRLGGYIAWTLSLIPLLIWLITSPDQSTRPRAFDSLTSLGQLGALTGMAMLCVSFVLASRLRFLEQWFGGLDKMYQEHHRLGKTAFFLILLHPVFHALRFIPQNISHALTFFLPLHHQSGINYGVYAFWLMMVLLFLTLYSTIAYDKWKLSHRFLGIVLMLGTIHMLTVQDTPGRMVALAQVPLLKGYMIGLAAMGMSSYGYKLLLLPLHASRQRYAVISVRKLNEEVLEVEMDPRGTPIRYNPGQFIFVTFYQEQLSRESHPFTLCMVPESDHLKITVKALGDFTTQLYHTLQPGTLVKVEGPYGTFDFRKGSRRQIWMAGGVGIAPFLSWARYLSHSENYDYDIIFYYCVHSRGDAVYHEEFTKISQQVKSLKLSLVCSEEQGHLHASDIKNDAVDLLERDIFMCGPKRLTGDMQRQLKALGVSDERIHYEDFEFK